MCNSALWWVCAQEICFHSKDKDSDSVARLISNLNNFVNWIMVSILKTSSEEIRYFEITTISCNWFMPMFLNANLHEERDSSLD